MNPGFPNEHQLVNALQGPTSPNFAFLYHRYATTLYRVLVGLVHDPVLAQDLLQDTFVTIWLNRHRYDPARGRLFTWLLTLTRHIAFDALKANQRRLLANTDNYKSFQEATSAIHFEGGSSASVWSGLAPKYRVIIELVYEQGYTSQEVANQLDLPLGTVKTRLRLALQQLRQFYQQDIHQYHHP